MTAWDRTGDIMPDKKKAEPAGEPMPLLDLAQAIRENATHLEVMGIETGRREGEVREIRERLKAARDEQNSRIRQWNERTGEKVPLVTYDK